MVTRRLFAFVVALLVVGGTQAWAQSCPPGYPYDCGNGLCCPSGYPYCCSNGQCSTTSSCGSGGGGGGTCPTGYPIDCGNGYCCDNAHPFCQSDGSCSSGSGGGGGSGGGTCPSGYPIDCGNGKCCDAAHPYCQSDGTCSSGSTGSGGSGGSGGGGSGPSCGSDQRATIASCGGDTCGCADACSQDSDCKSGCCARGFCALSCVCNGSGTVSFCDGGPSPESGSTGTTHHGCSFGGQAPTGGGGLGILMIGGLLVLAWRRSSMRALVLLMIVSGLAACGTPDVAAPSQHGLTAPTVTRAVSKIDGPLIENLDASKQRFDVGPGTVMAQPMAAPETIEALRVR